MYDWWCCYICCCSLWQLYVSKRILNSWIHMLWHTGATADMRWAETDNNKTRFLKKKRHRQHFSSLLSFSHVSLSLLSVKSLNIWHLMAIDGRQVNFWESKSKWQQIQSPRITKITRSRSSEEESKEESSGTKMMCSSHCLPKRYMMNSLFSFISGFGIWSKESVWGENSFLSWKRTDRKIFFKLTYDLSKCLQPDYMSVMCLMSVVCECDVWGCG